MMLLPRLHPYPERKDRPAGWQHRWENVLAGLRGAVAKPVRRVRTTHFVRAVNDRRQAVAALDGPAFEAHVDAIRRELRLASYREDLVVRSFAAIREAAHRHLGLFHHDVQVEGGRALLRGFVAELETGEGKTLTATLAAGTAALAGVPVHVITVNDYLARRDAGLMGPVYRALGLSVGTVVSGMSPDQRRAAYACDVTYCSNKEVAFDYLRDRMVIGNSKGSIRMRVARLCASASPVGEPVMRGLHFAIVDEADSVLIDEARTPLIISGRTDPQVEEQRAREALDIVSGFSQDLEFVIRRDDRQISLTGSGKARLQELGEALGGAWRGTLYREEQARTALCALHLFHRDEHYLVREDRIEIIDENTGRVMAERSWGDGLHQMMEVKEGCTVTGQTVPRARMTYQRFFRRYLSLSGMTGTAREARRELWAVYGLPVVSIATNRPLARRHAPLRIFRTEPEKWRHIVARTGVIAASGQPVLIGTRSVATSEVVSGLLDEAGIAHRVLNAAQDEHEAEIISQAGQTGQVTVATNMAGRGVDIRLEAGVAERGGLHIIMSEKHDSSRIDRQLFGRCARQGEPGQVEVVLSLEDALVAESGLSSLPMTSRMSGLLFRRAQRRMEARHARARRELMRWDERMGTVLAFAGRQE